MFPIVLFGIATIGTLLMLLIYELITRPINTNVPSFLMIILADVPYHPVCDLLHIVGRLHVVICDYCKCPFFKIILMNVYVASVKVSLTCEGL